MCLTEEKFRPLANAVGTEGVRTGRLALKDLQGLYAEDTYAVSAIDEIKILERGTVSLIEGAKQGKEPLPLQRNKGVFNLEIHSDWHDEKDEDKTDFEEEPEPTPEEIHQQLLKRIIQEQIEQRAQIIRLLTPLWISVIALGVLVLVLWE